MKVEIRSDSVFLDGYVNVPERRSKVLSSPHGKFVEVVAEHTFDKALKRNSNVKVLLNHNESRELGSQQQGNLKLYEDQIGLRAQMNITDADVVQKAKNNELRGFSFGFNVIGDGQRWENTDKGYQIRTLTDINLHEISVLDNTKIPAYNATSIEMRDESEVISEQRDFISENVETIDNSQLKEQEQEQQNSEIDKSENREFFSIDIYKKQIEILKLKGEI